MSGIMSNMAPYEKCDIIGTLEHEAARHMGAKQYEAFKRNVTLPGESMENEQRNRVMRENAEIFQKACDTGEWVHGQLIDAEVLAFLSQYPALLYGKHEGNSIVSVAIPFNTRHT